VLKIIQIEKKTRLSILAALLIIFIFLAYNAFLIFRQNALREKEIPVYKYTQTGKINYLVRLKPNNLYDSPAIGPGGIYLTNFVDKVETNFSYDFTAEKEAKIYGAYDIKATLEAYGAGKDKPVKIWEKVFPLMEQKNFEFQGKQAAFKETVLLDIPFYNQFLEAVNKASEMNASEAKLVVKCNIYAKAQTPEGVVSENMAPELSIPLGGKAFNIGPEVVMQKPGALSIKQKSLSPEAKKKRIVFSSLSALLLLLLLAFGLVTEDKPARIDPEKKMLDAIWKKHGDRIVQVLEKVAPQTEKTVHLSALDDLVKMADELSRPIFYEPRSGTGLHLFYIFDGYFRYECIVSVDTWPRTPKN